MLENYIPFIANLICPNLSKLAKIFPKQVEARRTLNSLELCARTFTK